ncbi:Tm-1-like ATP-binding domain-containing protein [Enterococcus sp. AZ196]|uniref:Tm-1-like ATP-binding domain-containing protein n=1 Tax=Enterococcus sp. AZ196 TaxID=2774659 RepID=UPI003D2A5811
MKTIALIGTFDSKGEEFQYVKSLLMSMNNNVLTINTGVFEPTLKPDIDANLIAEEVGESIEVIRAKKDRAYATEVLSRGVEKLLPRLYEEGLFDGILSFGGTGGTSLVTPGMRQIPIGVPKVMVSTVASGDTSAYVGTSDILMMPSIVDVSGLNTISRTIFQNAAAAISGMVHAKFEKVEDDRPLIAASMFGVTTPAVDYARKYLEENGYEVLVFHATGVGGKTMEHLIRNGYFAGVLDLTTTELADELVGGVLSAGRNRLSAASETGVPQVVSLGALDMVNFGPYETVPQKFCDRNLYRHNPTVTLMRTTNGENIELGKIIAHKLNKAHDKTVLLIPKAGVSLIDAPNNPFYGPEEDNQLFNTLLNHLSNEKVQVIERNVNINDPAFAEESAKLLIKLIEEDTHE